jgi:Flp pilus assembly pilin Flp
MFRNLLPAWRHARIALRGPLANPLKNVRPPLGQGMTEYIVVVAVVAVAAIGVYSLLGQTIRNQTAGIAQEIAGTDAGAALNAATSSSAAARSQANVRKDLKNYNQDNH